MIYTAIVLFVGIVVESKFHPRVKKETDGYYVHYTAKKGVRNKQKLF